MTAKIDTQAPDTSREADAFDVAAELFGAIYVEGKRYYPEAEYNRIEALSAAREAAAAQAMREAAAKVAQDKHDAAAKWAAHYLKSFDGQTDSLLIAQEIAALPLPDTTALDRLIAEQVREAVDSVSKLFEGCASTLVPADYAQGYREALEHVRDAALATKENPT